MLNEEQASCFITARDGTRIPLDLCFTSSPEDVMIGHEEDQEKSRQEYLSRKQAHLKRMRQQQSAGDNFDDPAIHRTGRFNHRSLITRRRIRCR